jgi:hypothetical protein
VTHSVVALPRRLLIACILAALLALAVVVVYATTNSRSHTPQNIHITDVTPNPSQGGGLGG